MKREFTFVSILLIVLTVVAFAVARAVALAATPILAILIWNNGKLRVPERRNGLPAHLMRVRKARRRTDVRHFAWT